jgi:hypothetical protein
MCFMRALRELQLQFVAALFDEREDAVHRHVREDGIDAGERIDIYRNNMREAFIKALALGFPVIERLGGTEYFRQLAVEFLRAHPSRHGNLHHIGGPFASWLRGKFERTEYSYFADVADLEWAYQEALVAPDAPALPLEALRQIDPAFYEDLTFRFHPACRFVRSDFPIVRIWQANHPDTASDEVIDLASGGDNVLVIRTPDGVELHRLPREQFVFLQSLAEGNTLGAALGRALEMRQELDVGHALQKLFALNLATALRSPQSPGGTESSRQKER